MGIRGKGTRVRTEYYREASGDFLVVWKGPGTISKDRRGWLGRSASLENIPSSVVTIEIRAGYLAACEKVKKSEIPAEWLLAIEGDG